MANKIILKKSSVASKVPLATDLEIGELSVNLTDQKLYTKNAAGTVVLVGSAVASGGDVNGPASSTDNALVRYDGITGKIIQNSIVTIDDAGNIENAIIDSFTNTVGADHVHYKIKANETIAKGNILKYVGWNAGANAIEVVKVSSATDVAIGMAHDDLATGEFGLAVVVGTTEGFDTSAYTAGTILYPNTSGGLTATKPTSGTYQACAFVIRSQSVNGAYLVNFSNPVYVEASTNTANTAVIRNASGNFSAGTITAALAGNATTATTLATGRTIGITGDLTYTSPSFNGSGNVTAAGTLATVNSNVGSFTNASVTVNAKGLVTAVSSGTAPVTSVTATSPVASTGGTTPVISMPAATTSVSGYLTSTDWNTFNSKTSNTGTVTSVAMTVPTGLTVSGTPITTSGTLAVTLTAGYSIPTTANQTNWTTAYTDRLKWDGGSTGLVAATGRTSLGGTTVGQNFFTLTNPSAIRFPRINADNTVSALDAATFRTAIGAGTSSTTGTVTSIIAGTGLSGGTITTSGTIALANTAVTAGAYTNANITVDAQGRITAAANGAAGGVTSFSGGTTGLTPSTATTGAITLAGTLALANGGTGATTAAGARTNLGATTVGGNLLTLANPTAITFLRVNADNTVSALDAATFRTAIGAGTSSTTGTVTSVAGTGTVNGLTLTGTVTTSGSLTLGGTLAIAATQVTSGTLAVARGGTGATTTVQGGIVYGASTSAYATTAASTLGYVLTSGGTGAPQFLVNDLTLFPTSNFKKSVKAATTANITLSAPQTIDGISCVAGDRVLVKNQTTTSQNGIYQVNAGAWTRTVAADGATEIDSAVVGVDQGTTNGGSFFTNYFKTTDVVGTTAMPWYNVIDSSYAVTSGSTKNNGAYVAYSGTTNTAGQFNGGTTTPTGSTRLNYSGYFYPTYLNLLGSADTTTAATHYFVEQASDGFVRPKTLANVKTELVTSAAVVAGLGYTPIASSAGGCIVENGQTISANYTMTSGKNGMSAGPITIATGITVTIPTGSNWVIV